MALHHMQIGEVAEQTSLSLRTIRYYEEMGLVRPAARSAGGFRLYSQSDVARLQLIRRMKPLEFSLEEMKDVLETLDALEQDATTHEEREHCVDRLRMYREAAEARVAALKDQLETAEGFAADLRREFNRQRKLTKSES